MNIPIILLVAGIFGAYVISILTGAGSSPPVTYTGGTPVLTVGSNLTAAQIAQLALAAGFQGDDAANAVAVALAESSGNPQAYNPETAAGAAPGQGSYGLWQIYLNAHPEDTGLNLFDPQTNANAAYGVYQQAGNSFSPWSTFKSGAYAKYLSEAIGAVNA